MKTVPMYFPDKFDLAKSHTCAQLVIYAYNMYSQWKMDGYPIQTKFDWKKPSSQTGFTFSNPIWSITHGWFSFLKPSEPFGFVAHDKNNAYLVFRGTESAKDWVDNLEFSQTDYSCVANYGKVHHGFFSIYKSLREECIEELQKLTDIDSLCITGHSLGSGLSTLAVPDMAAQFSFKRVNHYNFASPRVGNKDFVHAYNSNGVTTYRLVNTCDIVPQVPLAAFNTLFSTLIYTHIAIPIDFTAQYDSIDGNHSMSDAYRYALEHPDNPYNPYK